MTWEEKERRKRKKKKAEINRSAHLQSASFFGLLLSIFDGFFFNFFDLLNYSPDRRLGWGGMEGRNKRTTTPFRRHRTKTEQNNTRDRHWFRLCLVTDAMENHMGPHRERERERERQVQIL